MLPFPTVQCAGGRPRITTWDPAAKGSTLTLSNGNLTATGDTINNLNVRATTSLTNGVRVVRHSYTGAAFVGFCNATFPTISTADALGDDANGVRYYPSNGQVILNGVTLSTVATAAAGAAIDLAIDLTNRKLWVRVNGGNWNNNPAGNPATNSLGISISGLTGALYPAANTLGISSVSDTAAFYGVALPSGMLMWDE